MNTVILAFDDEDTELGVFYNACTQDLKSFLDERKINTIALPRRQINEASIQLITEQHAHFLFGAYSHGTDNSLVIDALPYVSTEINIRSFGNSFFYSCACQAGKKLGISLIDNGCATFVGYNEDFAVWLFNLEPFIDCANHGFKEFITGQTASEVIEAMKLKFNLHIDNYSTDMFGAANLVANRNALVRHGQDISISQMR